MNKIHDQKWVNLLTIKLSEESEKSIFKGFQKTENWTYTIYTLFYTYLWVVHRYNAFILVFQKYSVLHIHKLIKISGACIWVWLWLELISEMKKKKKIKGHEILFNLYADVGRLDI